MILEKQKNQKLKFFWILLGRSRSSFLYNATYKYISLSTIDVNRTSIMTRHCLSLYGSGEEKGKSVDANEKAKRRVRRTDLIRRAGWRPGNDLGVFATADQQVERRVVAERKDRVGVAGARARRHQRVRAGRGRAVARGTRSTTTTSSSSSSAVRPAHVLLHIANVVAKRIFAHVAQRCSHRCQLRRSTLFRQQRQTQLHRLAVWLVCNLSLPPPRSTNHSLCPA